MLSIYSQMQCEFWENCEFMLHFSFYSACTTYMQSHGQWYRKNYKKKLFSSFRWKDNFMFFHMKATWTNYFRKESRKKSLGQYSSIISRYWHTKNLKSDAHILMKKPKAYVTGKFYCKNIVIFDEKITLP